jgi:hypothetical protein
MRDAYAQAAVRNPCAQGVTQTAHQNTPLKLIISPGMVDLHKRSIRTPISMQRMIQTPAVKHPHSKKKQNKKIKQRPDDRMAQPPSRYRSRPNPQKNRWNNNELKTTAHKTKT